MPRIVSGMRPTGQLHIGHLLGALKNWISLQANAQNECFYFVADYHALTSNFDKTAELPKHVHDMVLDWIASGLDPSHSTIFVQSHILRQPQLYLLLSMITPLGWLERNPTYKEMLQNNTDQDLSNLGFFGYPVMQTADIILYKGEKVPVGQDQVAHLELSREIVRRFNHLFGAIFPEPQALLTSSPKIVGTDGRKMSKSYGNAILLSDTEAEIKTKIRGMITDVKRVKRQDPGNPDDCNLFPLHVEFSDAATQASVRAGCTTAGIGCVDCKNMLLPNLYKILTPIQEKRAELLKQKNLVADVLATGKAKASLIAERTMGEVTSALSL